MQFFIGFLILFNQMVTSDPADRPFIIVELFTSEGCSSCPPADQLLTEIINTNYDTVDVIGLSFHVDYWDYIGWKDPYADQSYSQRQRTYARKFYNHQVYTPQMVVNGKYEFVGSDRNKWSQLLGELRSTVSDQNVTSTYKIKNDQLHVEVVSGSKASVLLNVAIVESGLSQNVTRGENNGRRLSHENVVRSFKTRQFDGTLNTIILDIPSDLVFENANIIIYTQDQDSWQVLAAKSQPLVLD